MNDQEIRLVAQRLHQRQVELVEIREGRHRVRVRVAIRACTAALAAGTEVSLAEALPTTAAKADAIAVKASALGLLRLSHPLRALSQVAPGDAVRAGQSLALLEVKGVYSEVVSPCDGIVERVLADDGARVDYGMPLFALKVTAP